MWAAVRANLLLLVMTLAIGAIGYPLLLLLIGQAVFFSMAQGSLLQDKQHHVYGSLLIAQPFTADEYFQPRPSAASYNGAASGASNWGASNYLLRDRVARALGPIVKHGSGPRKGELVGPDVEAWFKADRFTGDDGKPTAGIVARWAHDHATVAQNWVKADKLNSEFVASWQREHEAEVAQWIKDNPGTPEPKPEDLAGPFFESWSKRFPGTFPCIVERKTGETTVKVIESVSEHGDIQAGFFDMWRGEHPDLDLAPVPADMVMASGSGLDPHITLANALYQLDRVAGAWAKKASRDEAATRKEIEALLRAKAEAVGLGMRAPLVNVLDINWTLKNKYGA